MTRMHLMDPLISISNLQILILKSYGQDIREEKWIRIVMKTMKAAKLHPKIGKKLKYFMLMGCGTEDGCHHLIFRQENESFMMITKQWR